MPYKPCPPIGSHWAEPWRSKRASLLPYQSVLAATKINTLSRQQLLVESGEIQTFRTIHLRSDLTTGTNQVGLADITKFFDLGEEFSSCEHGWGG